MTQADFEVFVAAFNRLTLALPNRVRDDIRGEGMAASKVLYFDALADLPIDAVVAGADEILKSEIFFPAPVEWRRAALSARFKFAVASLPSIAPGEVFCPACDDTGFAGHVCKVGARCSPRHAARAESYEHPYTTPCECRETNPVYQRDRLSMFGAPVRQIEQHEAKQLIAAVEAYSGKDRAIATERDE